VYHTDAKSLKERGDRLFSNKGVIDSRNQHIADHFYPERADFTTALNQGDDFAAHLVTGYPLYVRRSLGDAICIMQRPKSLQWFKQTVRDNEWGEQTPLAVRQWLEYAQSVQWRAMYDRKSNFVRSMKEGDHDFATFGQCVVSVEVNWRDTALLFRNWHLRDVAWDEDSYGQVASIHRNWEPTVREIMHRFKKLSPRVQRLIAEQKLDERVHVRHVIIRADEYGDKGGSPDALKRGKKHPWVSVYLDCDEKFVMQEVGSWTRVYALPRWQTISGSQYAMSPATLIGLPDARLLQAMTLTLLDAGERAANPPIIGVKEKIRGDLNLFPGGFTHVEADYDNRTGRVLEPLAVDKSGLPFGLDLLDATSAAMSRAFYLDKLSMPARAPEMTAYEVAQRVQEYMREAAPLFQPMEEEYTGAICELVFETLLMVGAYGPSDRFPEELSGRDIDFEFETPIATTKDRQKGELLLEAVGLLAQGVESDPGVAKLLNFSTAMRDAFEGIGVPAMWMRSEDDVDAAIEAGEEAQETAAVLDQMQRGADVAATLAPAAQSLGAAA